MHIRSLRDQHGASAVEFAIVLPLLFFIILGGIEFGYAFYQKVSLNSAVREGARILAVSVTDPNASTTAAERAEVVFGGEGIGTLTLTPTACTPGGIGNAEMAGKYTRQYVTPLGGLANLLSSNANLGGELVLASVGVMQCGG